MSDLSPVAEGEFFQLGYVTRNLARAMELWTTRYGVTGFFSFDTRDFAQPGHPGPFMKVALGYQGAVQVELIEPDLDEPGIYRDALPAGEGTNLHHLGYLVDPARFDGVRARFEAQGIPVPTHIAGEGGPTLLYADMRAENGLYAEFVARSDFMLGLFARIPRAA
jgi:hypothetical protein